MENKYDYLERMIIVHCVWLSFNILVYRTDTYHVHVFRDLSQFKFQLIYPHSEFLRESIFRRRQNGNKYKRAWLSHTGIYTQ